MKADAELPRGEFQLAAEKQMVSTGTLWTKGSIETHPAPGHAFLALPGCARHKIWGLGQGDS